MNASYELHREDLAAFSDFHQRTSPAARKYRTKFFGIAFALFAFFPVWIVMTSDKPRVQTAKDIWPLFLGPLLFAIFALPYVRWRSRHMSRRLLNEGKNAGFYGKCELTICDGGLTETRPSGTTSRNWSSVERVALTPQHLFVYTSGIEAFVVPRSAFSTVSDCDAFAKTICDNSGVQLQRT
jgi:YcxB-like protein